MRKGIDYGYNIKKNVLEFIFLFWFNIEWNIKFV